MPLLLWIRIEVNVWIRIPSIKYPGSDADLDLGPYQGQELDTDPYKHDVNLQP